MNNSEELWAAIERRVPPRIPYTYEAHRQTNRNVRRYLGLADDASLEEHFGCNWTSVPWAATGRRPRLPDREARNAASEPGVTIDIWGRRTRTVIAGGMQQTETVYTPLADAESVSDIEKHDVEELDLPDLPDDFDLAEFKRGCVVMLWAYPNIFSKAWSLRGMDKMMMDLSLNPAIVEAIVARIEEFHLGCMEAIFRKYPGLIDLVRSSDDWGSQAGLLISPQMAERFFLPTVRRYFDLARRHGALAYQHSCGAVFELIPSLIDAGLSVLNPIQTSADGMDPARLKAEFGRDLCFHGGIDTQQTLVTGSPDDVRAEVRSRIDTLGPNGYILAASHVMQPDIPPANIVALFEEARAYGASAAG